MKTVITNGTITIDFNKNASIIANFQAAQAAGFNGGRTSFFYLVKGEVCQVKGFRMVEVDEKVEKVARKAKANLKLADHALAAAAILSLMPQANVVEAARKTYGTQSFGGVRVQLDPKADGSFRVAVYGNNEKAVALVNEFGLQQTAQYAHIKADATQAQAIIEFLAN